MEPELPILRILPTLPMLKILPVLPILRILPALPILRMLPALKRLNRQKMLPILSLLSYDHRCCNFIISNMLTSRLFPLGTKFVDTEYSLIRCCSQISEHKTLLRRQTRAFCDLGLDLLGSSNYCSLLLAFAFQHLHLPISQIAPLTRWKLSQRERSHTHTLQAQNRIPHRS